MRSLPLAVALITAFATSAPALGAAGICLGDFACAGLTTCATTSDCDGDSICVLDSCCGPGVCVTRDHICNDDGGAAAASRCAPAGQCPSFVLGCGAGDASCQAEFSVTACFASDIVAQSTAAPALTLPGLVALIAILIVFAAVRQKRDAQPG